MGFYHLTKLPTVLCAVMEHDRSVDFHLCSVPFSLPRTKPVRWSIISSFQSTVLDVNSGKIKTRQRKNMLYEKNMFVTSPLVKVLERWSQLNMFQCSLDHKIRYKSLISDGDSKTYSLLRSKNVYGSGEDDQVIKLNWEPPYEI